MATSQIVKGTNLALLVLTALLAVLLLWTPQYVPAPPSLSKASILSSSATASTSITGDSATVASQYRRFRNGVDPTALSLSERNSMFHELCSVSLGTKPCYDLSSTCAVGYDTELPYEIYLDKRHLDPTCARRITGSLPVTVDHLDLLISFAHTFKLQWQSKSELWDIIWIVAPAEQVATIYQALEAAGVLHHKFRIISQDVILQEMSKDPRYKGWHLQQDLKLALAWASRTNYLLNLDADIMIGKALSHEDLFTHDGLALTISAIASKHWTWHHKNFQNTCRSVQIDCEGINRHSTIIGFTPIPFYVPTIFSMAKYLSEREQRPWLEYLISIRTRRKPGEWSEYSLYFVYARWRDFYHKYHAPISADDYRERLDPLYPEDLEDFYAQPVAERVPFLDVAERDIRDLKAWREGIVEIDDPYRDSGS